MAKLTRHQFDGGQGEAAALRRERETGTSSPTPMARRLTKDELRTVTNDAGLAERSKWYETTMTDDTPMPFGKYGPKNGKPGNLLKHVPADYLLWLWDNGPTLRNEKGGLANYIRANFKAICADAPDAIPTKPHI